MEKTNDKAGVFEIDDLIKETYTKIATWHNDDASQPALKTLSLELIEDIAGAAFKYLDLPFNLGVLKSKEVKNESDKPSTTI